MLRRRARHGHADPARLRRQALTVVVLFAAGCGGGEATTTDVDRPKPLTKAEFLHEADRICFAIESQIEAAADDLVAGKGDPPPAQVRRIVDEIVVPRLRSEADTIRLLDAPLGDAAEVERILEATERGAGQLAGDPLSAVDRLPSGLREAERLARAYGSEQCGLRQR